MWRIRWFCCLWRSIRFTSAMNIWTYLDWNQSVKRSNFSFKIAVGSHQPLFFTKRIEQPFKDKKRLEKRRFLLFGHDNRHFMQKGSDFWKKYELKPEIKFPVQKSRSYAGFWYFDPENELKKGVIWPKTGNFISGSKRIFFYMLCLRGRPTGKPSTAPWKLNNSASVNTWKILPCSRG